MKKLIKVLFVALFAVNIGVLNIGKIASAQENIELNVWTWDSVQADGVQAAIDAYEEQNPNVTVNYELIPSQGGNADFMLKLEAGIEADTAADIFWLNIVYTDFAEAGALEPLDEYIANDDFDLSAYSPFVTEIYNFEGQQYGIPKDMDAWFIIYNKSVFDEAGVEYPADDWTWEDFLEVGGQLKESMDEGQFPLYFNTSASYGLNALTRQQGSTYIIEEEDGTLTPNFDSEEFRTALNQLLELQEKELSPHLINNADYDYLSSLISGNLAVAAVPSWEISAIATSGLEDGSFGAVAFPSNNGSSSTDTNGLAYVMNAASENKEAAWDLMKFLTSDEGARLHAENGAGLPANNNPEVKEAWVNSNSSIDNLEVVYDIAENSYLRETNKYLTLRPVAASIVENIYPKFFSGEIDVDEAALEAQALAEEAFSE